MKRNKVLALITAVSVSACLYACGSDDDTNPSGGAGSSGHAGKGGSGGTGAKGGSANGGSGGKVVAGGSGNEAGESSAGEGGTSNAGAGGDSSGIGGDNGLGGSGDAGAAGAAATEQTLTEACTTSCGPSHTVSSCSTTVGACVSQCTAYPTQVQQSVDATFISTTDAATLNKEYLTLVRCMASHLTNTDQYACAAAGTMVGATSPAASTDCETVLCKWTCDDANFGTSGMDADVAARCGC